jgi:hypothetical protein
LGITGQELDVGELDVGVLALGRRREFAKRLVGDDVAQAWPALGRSLRQVDNAAVDGRAELDRTRLAKTNQSHEERP